jgi:hypothetical protein
MTTKKTKRRAKPRHIYREEVFSGDSYGNSTRQTYDKQLFEEWVAYAPIREQRVGWKSRFYIGMIDWAEIKEDDTECAFFQ